MTTIKTERTIYAVCPYCGKMDEGCRDYQLGDGERVLVDCVRCSKPHYVEGHVEYTTHKIVGVE